MKIFKRGIIHQNAQKGIPQVASLRVGDVNYSFIIVGKPFGCIRSEKGYVKTWERLEDAKEFLQSIA